MRCLFRFLSHFPLWLLQTLGMCLGVLMLLLSSAYRHHLRSHARQANYVDWWFALQTAMENGKMVIELPKVWFGVTKIREGQGWQLFKDAVASPQGVLILTPHVGSFERGPAHLTSYLTTQGKNLTVLFKPPHSQKLRSVMEAARSQGVQLAPTTSAGVKKVLKALRDGQVVAMLPDQVPPVGQGIWVPFFSRPAYTMTLAAKLAQQTQCIVLYAWVERLSWGRGYSTHFLAPSEPMAQESVHDTVLCMNAELEKTIRQKPEQYLWGYDRYRQPRDTL